MDVVDPRVDGVIVAQDVGIVRPELAAVLEWKLMSCGQVKSCLILLTWLLIGCSLLSSQSGARLLVDPTLDNDYNS